MAVSTIPIPVTSSVSRFKVTPVLEAQPIESLLTSDVKSTLNHIALNSEFKGKKQGRFHITRVADETSEILVETSKTDNTKNESSITGNFLEQSQNNVLSEELSLQNRLPNPKKAETLQTSSSNPALTSAFPQNLIPTDINSFTRSTSDISVANKNLKYTNEDNNDKLNNTTIIFAHETSNSEMSCDKQFENAIDANSYSKTNTSASYTENGITPNVSDFANNELKNGEVPVTESVIYSHQSTSVSCYEANSTTLSSSLSITNDDVKVVNNFQNGTTTDVKEYPCTVACTISNSDMAFSFSTISCNQVIQCPDTISQITEMPPICSTSTQMVDVQPPVLKDANANPLDCTYNSDDSKNFQVSL